MKVYFTKLRHKFIVALGVALLAALFNPLAGLGDLFRGLASLLDGVSYEVRVAVWIVPAFFFLVRPAIWLMTVVWEFGLGELVEGIIRSVKRTTSDQSKDHSQDEDDNDSSQR